MPELDPAALAAATGNQPVGPWRCADCGTPAPAGAGMRDRCGCGVASKTNAVLPAGRDPRVWGKQLPAQLDTANPDEPT